MKERASFTLDKKTIKILNNMVEEGDYRNRSHLVEEAIKKLNKLNKLDRDNQNKMGEENGWC